MIKGSCFGIGVFVFKAYRETSRTCVNLGKCKNVRKCLEFLGLKPSKNINNKKHRGLRIGEVLNML